MSVPAYPDYKDSGVAWLGAVPSHWSVVRTRFLCNIETGDADTVDADELGEYPFFVRSQSVERISRFTHDCEAVLTAGDGVGVGKVFHHFDGKFCAHQRVYIFCQFANILSRYFFYFMRELFSRVVLEGTAKSTVDSLRRPMLADFPISYPATSDQQKIISFLDRETAKIDALVAEQERLIALLKEKRQAVISHAVTKGLNPDAPMKDCGIEWLGDIPAHWSTLPLKAVSKGEGTVFIDGDWIESKDISDEGIRYITTGNVGEGIYREQGSGFISEETFKALNCTEVMPGDILISRLNLPIGRACIVPDLGARIVTSVDNVIVRAGDHVNRAYLTFLLSAKAFFAHTETLARGTTMQRISRTVLGNIRICLPALDEQQQIVSFLVNEAGKLDSLVNEAQSAITLLQERRAALISAAVTGKIDVRGLVGITSEMEAA